MFYLYRSSIIGDPAAIISDFANFVPALINTLFLPCVKKSSFNDFVLLLFQVATLTIHSNLLEDSLNFHSKMLLTHPQPSSYLEDGLQLTGFLTQCIILSKLAIILYKYRFYFNYQFIISLITCNKHNTQSMVWCKLLELNGCERGYFARKCNCKFQTISNNFRKKYWQHILDKFILKIMYGYWL